MTWTVRARTAGDFADPYLSWSAANEFRGHAAAAGQPKALIPLLLALAPEATLQQLKTDHPQLQVPGIYKRGKNARFLTGFMPRDDLEKLTGSKSIARFEFALPLSSGDIDPLETVMTPAAPGRLVMAVVDQDVAFLNKVFRRQALGQGRLQTRIVGLWDQSIAASGQDWRSPHGFGYGREVAADALDALLARLETGESEESIYRSMTYLTGPGGMLPDKAHGTFVLDTAAGLPETRRVPGSAKPERADSAGAADLIVVNLPGLSAGNTTGASPGAFVLDAVRYVLDRAGAGAKVVINFSVGAQGGPHDGTSMIEEALAEIMKERGSNLAVTVAAGNGAKDRCSACGQLDPFQGVANGSSPVRLLWNVQPGDVTDSFVEVWTRRTGTGPRDAEGRPAGVSLRAIPPGQTLGANVGWVAVDHIGQLDGPSGGAIIGQICHLESSALGFDNVALLSVAPTSRLAEPALAGIWTIEIRNESERAVDFDAWIQHDEPPTGFVRRIQSRFEGASGAAVDAGSTLNSLGTAAMPVLVGASRLSDHQATGYSAGPGNAPRGRTARAIDMLAPADENGAGRGLWAAGVRSGALVRMSGTSVSAAVAARQALNLLAVAADEISNKELRDRLLSSGVPPATAKAASLARPTAVAIANAKINPRRG